MLYTNLKHIESADEYSRIIGENENVVVICGRMSSICIPVYETAEHLAKKYRHVKFYDMEFDHPEAYVIRDLPEVKKLETMPYTLYFKKGEVIKATENHQTREQLISLLNESFGSRGIA